MDFQSGRHFNSRFITAKYVYLLLLYLIMVCFISGACGGGSCQDVDGKMHCLCTIGTTGKKCEQKIKILTPAFKHGSYLAYPTPKTMRK